MSAAATRLPWLADFPDVVLHTTVRERDSHPAYASAKAGDPEDALTLASELLDSRSVGVLRSIIGAREAFLLPVIADETLGSNAIPDAMAQVLDRDLDLPVIAGEIVQTNKVGHTRAPAFQRLVTPAVFDGDVQAGAAYVMVDDHVGLGGTLANLRGHVETHGWQVIAITTLTESRDARRISLRPETRDMLWGGMAKNSTNSGGPSSCMGSTVSLKSKPSSYVVSHPLPASRISWLRQQSKHVAAVSHQRFSEPRQS